MVVLAPVLWSACSARWPVDLPSSDLSSPDVVRRSPTSAPTGAEVGLRPTTHVGQDRRDTRDRIGAVRSHPHTQLGQRCSAVWLSVLHSQHHTGRWGVCVWRGVCKLLCDHLDQFSRPRWSWIVIYALCSFNSSNTSILFFYLNIDKIFCL